MLLKALVIDDSRVMRAMVMQSLQMSKLAQFAFVEAEDGVDALAKFNPNDVHIAFVDWNMPNMTGVEFVRQAHAMAGAQDIPMVMVTSEKSMAKVQEALDQAGADGYICKPFTVEDMQIKLANAIEKAENRRRHLQHLGDKPQQSSSTSGLFRSIFG